MAAVIAEPRARGAPAGAIRACEQHDDATRERFQRGELPPIRGPRE